MAMAGGEFIGGPGDRGPISYSCLSRPDNIHTHREGVCVSLRLSPSTQSDGQRSGTSTPAVGPSSPDSLLYAPVDISSLRSAIGPGISSANGIDLNVPAYSL